MSDYPNLRAMAEALDAHALELAEADDYEGAKLVIETAMAFEARHRQTLDVGWPKS
ncbi:hypothetical protein [Rhodococcus qingshengii]|uniref:hypothetical protein n=1 Tax=Rhodococcus qingshengii TaxID=334542 RepID=UPI002B00126F|nr:hypothetical protein [Rhodococcus qingshengii]MEA1798509.1 hypothetical protein [Rhodococcus qingshengii]